MTGFFRDPEAWEALRERVIVPLVAARGRDASIRAWVAASGTGEEAYTLAMLLCEEAERVTRQLHIKIFATDAAEGALQKARQGLYPASIESQLSPARLERFFQRDDVLFRVRRELRELVVFAPHNLFEDPPFSRLDIVSCRNLLAGLDRERQQRVLSLLHFGLNEGGALFLGTGETAGPDNSFEPLDEKARLFRRMGPTRHGAVVFPLRRTTAPPEVESTTANGVSPQSLKQPISQLTSRALLEQHVPAAVTVDREFRILYYHGNTTPFLQHPPGAPTRDLMLVVRDSIRGAVRSALYRAMAQSEPVVENGWTERDDGARELVAVVASRIGDADENAAFVLSFRHLGDWPDGLAERAYPVADDGIHLRQVREDLQNTVEQLRRSNEELQAAHEDVVSTNEELQSTNEELEMSREEMQSLNEELSTVNGELQTKMEEHRALASDLASLLTSTDIAVLFLDTHFRIRRYTPQMTELLDVIPTDVGRPLSDLACKFDDPHLLAEAAQVLDRLVPLEREIRVGDDRWFMRRLTPYRTTANRIDGVVITFVDTTDRRRTEEALRRSEERFRGSIEHAPIPVIMFAENGEVLQLSEEWTAVTGHRLEDLPVVEAWLGSVNADSAETIRSRLSQLFAGELRALETDVTVRTQAGEQRHWSLRASSPGALPDGRRMCVGMAVDITERRRAEAELQASKDVVEAASAMKDRFLANISHELRTPLSVILMWSKLLAAGDVSESDHHDAIEAIVRSAEAQRRLIEDLLDTTRIASGKLRVTLKPVELDRVVEAAVEVVRPLAENKSLSLSVRHEESPAAVLADAGRLEQVVWILLMNAVKFTPPGGSIEVVASREGESVTLRVADTGNGIPAEFLPQLFRPFAQADLNGNSPGGLGLGLSIARSLVQLHGGTISAISDGHGKGATFTVRLPRHVPGAGVAGAENSRQISARLNGVTVMLVDDNADAIRAFSVALRCAGARVESLENAKAALETFRSVAPQVLISDLNMPQMDGLEFLRAIRTIEEGEKMPPTKAIALTALATGSDRASALASGFDIFLTKPIEPEVLIAETHALVHGSMIH